MVAEAYRRLRAYHSSGTEKGSLHNRTSPGPEGSNRLSPHPKVSRLPHYLLNIGLAQPSLGDRVSLPSAGRAFAHQPKARPEEEPVRIARGKDPSFKECVRQRTDDHRPRKSFRQPLLFGQPRALQRHQAPDYRYEKHKNDDHKTDQTGLDQYR
jgi:hypothetical protein